MVDSEYSKSNYNSSKISIGAIIEDLEILRLAPVHVKTKRCVNMQLKS